IDEVAMQFDVEIVRLPTKHCGFNPMEHIYNLVAEFIAGFDEGAAYNAIEHAHRIENTFRTGDRFFEERVEPDLKDIDSDTEMELDNDDEV
ncbi:unnamed protein product, partial [Rotaria sp. Silwood1]